MEVLDINRKGLGILSKNNSVLDPETHLVLIKNIVKKSMALSLKSSSVVQALWSTYLPVLFLGISATRVMLQTDKNNLSHL